MKKFITIEISDWEPEQDVAEEVPTILTNIAAEVSEGMTKGGNINTPYRWKITDQEYE